MWRLESFLKLALFVAPFSLASVNAVSAADLLLRCDATRLSERKKVEYVIEIEKNFAWINGSRWSVSEEDKRIVLDYDPEGTEGYRSRITIDRVTGKLFHAVLGGSTVYRTMAKDSPSNAVDRRF